jgi:predicted Zn finger-like uncharacterized protein
MKISDIVCPECGSSYLVAESTSAAASPGNANCAVCGALLAAWQEPRMRAYRLEMAPELRYARVQPPPPPN